ncbi:MAG TPA: LCP family protein [Anaerolineales bacterium]|jgi:LCP family protein required for cell wall assembly
MKPRRFNSLSALLGLAAAGILIAGCGSAPAPTANSLPFVLVTAALDASPTATPFQPSLSTPTLFEPIIPLPTGTPSPTATPPLDATATVDLNQLFPTSAAPPAAENPGVQPTALTSLTDNETVNFLLIGSDKRPGASYRTDTMVIAILWPREGQVSLISIPRDLWIYIPTVGMQRINTAYQSGEIYGYPGGGPGLLKETIAYNLGIRIDHTAMVEFDGFRRIVDTLGGMDVPISCSYTDWRLIDPSYDPFDDNNWWLYTVGPGLIHMDGDLALWYARARSKSNDFDRGRRQQEVLRSIFNQALRTDTLNKIPQLYNDLSSTVVTDLGLGDVLKLAPYAPRLTNADIRGYYIRPPHVSSWITPGGASVLLPNEASLQAMLAEATTFSPRAVERESIVVEVQNGTNIENYDALAASRLNYAGYETHISAADRRDYASSVLVDLTAAQDATPRFNLLSSLGLYDSAGQISIPDPNSQAEYRLILGYDYEPCFQPEDLSH